MNSRQITYENDVMLLVDEDVFILDIPVNDSLVTQITNSGNQLRENRVAQLLVNDVILLDKIEEI